MAVLSHKVPVVGGWSPWGLIQSVEPLGLGDVPELAWVSTAGHGGLWVCIDEFERFALTTGWKTFAGRNWFEEDADAAAAVVWWNDLFEPKRVHDACKAVLGMRRGYHSWLVERRAMRLLANSGEELTTDSARALVKRCLGRDGAHVKLGGVRAKLHGWDSPVATVTTIGAERTTTWQEALRRIVNRNGEF
jgi:hypothetical protein